MPMYVIRVVFGGRDVSQHVELVVPYGTAWVSLSTLGPHGQSVFVRVPGEVVPEAADAPTG